METLCYFSILPFFRRYVYVYDIFRIREHSDVQAGAYKKSAKATVAKHGLQFYRKIGQAGGKKAQNEGSAHKLTNEERSRGGKH